LLITDHTQVLNDLKSPSVNTDSKDFQLSWSQHNCPQRLNFTLVTLVLYCISLQKPSLTTVLAKSKVSRH